MQREERPWQFVFVLHWFSSSAKISMQSGMEELVKIGVGGVLSTHPLGGSTFMNKVDKEAD